MDPEYHEGEFSESQQVKCRNYSSPRPKPFSIIGTPGSTSKKTGMVYPMMSSPSPAPKMVSSGQRNDLFRSVVASPLAQESRSYTPMSATPSGISPRPVFKTPLRNGHMSPVNMSTPKDSRPPPGMPKSFSHQKRKVRNPFDAVLLDQLEGHVFMSPGVFSVQSTPSTDEKKPFRWSIEHLAVLHPADIDEMPNQQDHITPDKAVEDRAQKAIDNYFATNLIAPSPWSENPPKPHVTGAVTPNVLIEPDMHGSIQKQLPKKGIVTAVKDVGCQTMLSLPLTFDIESVLGQYMTKVPVEESNQEILSTSSLRRKLFFQGDTSSYALSPVKTGLIDGDMIRESGLSPLSRVPGEEEIALQQATPLKPPSRSHFSSSPIKRGLHTPLIHGTPSGGKEYLDSPHLSPIIHGHMVRKRGSGLFSPHDGSFVDSDNIQRDMSKEFAKQLSSPELSPIRSDIYHTPAPKERSKLAIDSPGFSPICSASPKFDKDEQGSYIGDDRQASMDDDVSEEEVTPFAGVSRIESQKRTTRKISHLSRHKQNNIVLDFNDTAMDFEAESQHPPKHLRFADDIKTSSFSHSRDFSSADMDIYENNPAPNSTIQDTGYQTASLQSTNHDTGVHATSTSSQELCYQGYPIGDGESGQHTNITSLFSKLPLDSFVQETDERELYIKNLDDSAVDIPIQQPLIDQIMDVTNPEKFGHGPYNEEEILERARQVLDMANRLYPDIQSCSPDQDVTSQIMDRTGISLLHELEPIVSSTPYKGHVKKDNTGRSHLTPQVMSQKEPSASEQALAILRRAGEDLAKFGHLLSSIKTSVQNHSIPSMPS